MYYYLYSLPLAQDNVNDISLKEDEVYVDDKKSEINKDVLIRSITIGIPASAGQMMENMLTCEMCNYMTPYEEQLYLHKMTHGNVVVG